MKICKVDGCNKKHLAKGYCSKHYTRFIKYGDPNKTKEYPTICKIQGCEGRHIVKGYCRKHYTKIISRGNTLNTDKRESHSMSNTRIYSIWNSMKYRCFNKNSKPYHRYGGRGITVCDKWKNSFIAFYEDMGPKPFPKAEIDRIDNNGDYEPGNCRWVTPAVNVRNSSKAKLTRNDVDKIKLEYSKDLTIKELSRRYHISNSVIWRIVKNKSWVN